MKKELIEALASDIISGKRERTAQNDEVDGTKPTKAIMARLIAPTVAGVSP